MADKEAGMANWIASNDGLQDEFDAVATCQQLSMEGYYIVAPSI